MSPTKAHLTDEQHEQCARALFNDVWTMLENPDRTEEECQEMIKASHASAYHWLQVGKPVNFARSEWQIARVYAVANRPEPAIHHAKRCLKICRDHEMGEFDLAFAYEALARAHAVAGDEAEAQRNLTLAEETGQGIDKDEDRQYLLQELRNVAAIAAG